MQTCFNSFSIARLPRIEFGRGVFAKAAGLCARYGRNLLLVTGAQSFKSSAFYEQLLSEDRDQTPTHLAIIAFERLLKEHPDSAYGSKAKERIQDCRKLLADHELYVANFYYKSKHYRAALTRFEALLAGFSDLIPSDKQSQVKKLILACKEQLGELPVIDSEKN